MAEDQPHLTLPIITAPGTSQRDILQGPAPPVTTCDSKCSSAQMRTECGHEGTTEDNKEHRVESVSLSALSTDRKEETQMLKSAS